MPVTAPEKVPVVPPEKRLGVKPLPPEKPHVPLADKIPGLKTLLDHIQGTKNTAPITPKSNMEEEQMKRAKLYEEIWGKEVGVNSKLIKR